MFKSYKIKGAEMSRSIIVSIVLLIFLGLNTGCSQKFFAGHKEQLGFTAPNSNVVTTGNGKVIGTASSTTIYPLGATLAMPSFSAALKEEAHQDALKGTDGDFLINADVMQGYTVIPLLLVTIITSTIEVEGQPAKVSEIGKQKLN